MQKFDVHLEAFDGLLAEATLLTVHLDGVFVGRILFPTRHWHIRAQARCPKKVV